jgi:RHS repeat-associated protein
MVFSTFSLLAMTMNASILFSWDARGRLHAITERDASNSGYNWTATYDALNRRLSTTSILVTNGVAFTSQPNTINSYFDPQKEFLELGVNYGGTTEFKLYGPGLNLFEPTISDFRGNILGVVTNSAVVWNPSRPTGFGAVPGYQPVALGNGADIVVSSAWRGRWADITGYYNIGLRPYDPISGRWLTYDSVWNEIDPSGMTFCGGDPVNSVDSDGRLAANGPDNSVQNLNFGTMAVMNTYLQTTRYLSDGSIVINGYPGDNGSVFDPSMWGYSSYTTIRTDTGLSQFYVSIQPLPSDYSQPTFTPIETWQVEQQKDTEGAIFLAESILMLDTGTGEFAPEIFGTGTTSADLVAARQSLAQQFYQDAGWPADRIANHLQGIDFSQPVDVITVPQGTQVVQYQIPGQPVGNYFAPVGTQANGLGIYTSGRVGSIFTATEDTTVLRSTAASVNNTWEVPGWNIQAPGGNTQLFSPNPGAFSHGH